MTTLPAVALTTLMLIAFSRAHPQYPVVYYGSGQPYTGGYYNLPPGASRINSVSRYGAPIPVQSNNPGQYIYVQPVSYSNIASPQAPFLFRQEEPIGQAPDTPPPARPGVWTMFVQWLGVRPQEPTVAPAEETTEAPTVPETQSGEEVPAAEVPVVAVPAVVVVTEGVAPGMAEETTESTGQKTPDKPEKVMESPGELNLNANLENLDETIPEEGSEMPSQVDVGVTKRPIPDVPPPTRFFGIIPGAVGGGPVAPGPVGPLVIGPLAVRSDSQYVPVQQPQFYGNFDVFQQGQLPLSPTHNVIDPNRIYFREQHQSQYPYFQYPYQPQPFPVVPPPPARSQALPQHHYHPGKAALNFQKTIQASKREQMESRGAQGGQFDIQGRGAFIPGSQHVDISQLLQKQLSPQPVEVDQQETAQFPSEEGYNADNTQTYNRDASQPGIINVGPGYQNLYFYNPKQNADDKQSISVEAPKVKKEGPSSEAENVTVVEEQAGPSVAQAKPQAIAVAGPGGVAAATPVATALVGPGGLAVAAPTATAVAGQTGGGTIAAPAMAAVNKYLTQGKKAKEDDYSQSVVAYGF